MNNLPSSVEVLSSELARLSDKELLAEVGRAAGDERKATARLVATLVEVDKRQLYRDAGCSSLYTFCTDGLGLSESEAYLRMEAARAARRFPLILERLADGSVTLTAVSMLARHLTEDNHVALLDEARHKSKREIEAILARLSPRPEAVSIVRKLSVARVVKAIDSVKACVEDRGSGREVLDEPPIFAAAERAATERVPIDVCGTATSAHEGPARNGMLLGPYSEKEPVLSQCQRAVSEGVSKSAPRSGPRSDVTQLSPERYRVQVTIGGETHEKLRRAQDLLRHVVPNGDLEEVFDRAIALLLAELEKTRLGATSRPRLPRLPAAEARAGRPGGKANLPGAGDGDRPRESPGDEEPGARCSPSKPRRSRHIPAAVKREVVRRDGLRCTFVGADGRRCREAGLLEFHHRHPFAAGGPNTASNVVVTCRRHNALEAERFFDRSCVPNSPLDSKGRTATTEHVDSIAVNSVQNQFGGARQSPGP